MYIKDPFLYACTILLHLLLYTILLLQTNTFQAILATDSVYSFALFLYADGEIQWTTDDASGGINGLSGTPAQVGFDAGDGVHYATIPGSRSDAIINVTRTSNVGVPGMWVFRIDEEEVVIAGCQRVTAAGNGIVYSHNLYQISLC